MVWAAFAGNRRISLHILNGGLEAPMGGRHRRLLENTTMGIACRPRIRFYVHAGNSPIHTYHPVRVCLDQSLMEVMNLPTYSPDSILLNTFGYLAEKKLRESFPDISVMRGGPDRVKKAMGPALQLSLG